MPPDRLLIADECVHVVTVQHLRDAGWSVRAVIEESPSKADVDVLVLAVELDAILITNDRDFGELLFHRGRRPPGCVLYVRIRDFPPEIVAERLLAALDDPRARGHMVVVERDGNRYRALPPTGEENG